MGLFGGKSEEKQVPAAAAPIRERSVTASPRTAATTTTPKTVLGKDAVIQGEITTKSDMLIEGRVEGKIEAAGRVVIGESGNVSAEVHAAVITVQGEVHGDCEASKKVEITATGKVFGNITAGAIVVAEGATFRGASRMVRPSSQPTPVASRQTSSKPDSEPGSSASRAH